MNRIKNLLRSPIGVLKALLILDWLVPVDAALKQVGVTQQSP